MEAREDVELRRRKAESDRLFSLYQHEKERQRDQDVQVLSRFQKKQAVGYLLRKTKQRFQKYSE